MRFTKSALALAILAGAVPASASAPVEWEKMYKRANRACVAMSGLARPQLLAQRISFSDTIPVEARMIRGVDNRGRMKRILCLFDRRSGRAEVQEAPNWLGATTRP